MPGRVRAARPARRNPQRSARQAARPHRQCRRLVRHEGAALSRIHPDAARRAPARAAGQVDRRALDADGRFLALRLTGTGNMGAYLGAVAPLPPTLNAVKNMVSVYRTPLIEVSTQCVITNTTMVSAYRGAGRPEGNYFMERLIDAAAQETGIDRLELRRRNLIKPKEIPYAAASDQTYDSGDFPAVFKHALELADWKGFPGRKRESK